LDESGAGRKALGFYLAIRAEGTWLGHCGFLKTTVPFPFDPPHSQGKLKAKVQANRGASRPSPLNSFHLKHFLLKRFSNA
ncbi:MAG: hypothetical protein SNJ81_15480, partial [Cyanobacteriota bacterium]